MDLGCYSIQWARFAAGPDPEVVSAEAVSPVEGIDGSLVAELRWPSGVTGRIGSSMIAPGPDEVIYLRVIGEREGLEPDICALLNEAEELTKGNTRLTLVVAFNYGSRQEIAGAARRLVGGVAPSRPWDHRGREGPRRSAVQHHLMACPRLSWRVPSRSAGAVAVQWPGGEPDAAAPAVAALRLGAPGCSKPRCPRML